MSEMSYNGVPLGPYVRTREFRQEPIFTGADGSGDYLYTHYFISVEGVWNANSGPGALSETPAEAMEAIRAELFTPRQQLLFSVNGDRLLTSPPIDAVASSQALRNTDAKNGPIPRSVNILPISVNENTFIVNFSVDTWLVDCVTGEEPGGQLFISNRFTTDFTIDQAQYVTVITKGRVYTRADMNVNPDALRGVVAPKLPNGFLNKRSNFTVQEDGLAMDYTFEDVEVFREPPQPVYMADGEYICSSPYGAVGTGEVRLKLTGAKSQTPGLILSLCVLLAIRKITGGFSQIRNNMVLNPGTILQGCSIRHSFSENWAEVAMRVQYPASTFNAPGNVPTNLNSFGDNTWYTRAGNPKNNASLEILPAPQPDVYGNASLIANLAYLRDACSGLMPRTENSDLGEIFIPESQRQLGGPTVG